MVWRVLRRVYAHPVYWLITPLVAYLTFTVVVVLPSYSTLLAVLLSPVVSVVSKVGFFLTLYGTIATNFAPIASVAVILISVLFGVNASLLLYYVRRARGAAGRKTAGVTTLSGAVATLFGIGCAACGSAVILFVLKLIGIMWIVTYLPFHGAEFAIVGVVLLLLTSYSLIKKINDPLVCSV